MKSIIQENWDEFVVSSPSLFNQILKHCVKRIDNKLAIAYETRALDDPKNDHDLSASPDTTLNQDYEALFTDMLFADVVLVTSSGNLKAHKVILSGEFQSNCPKFPWINLKISSQVDQRFSEPCSSTIQWKLQKMRWSSRILTLRQFKNSSDSSTAKKSRTWKKWLWLCYQQQIR